MELLPIIYNSLLIAAGLFVITIAISYVSYKVKQNKGTLQKEEEIEYKSVFKDRKRIEEELKPHYRTKTQKQSSRQKSERKAESKPERREPPREKRREKPGREEVKPVEQKKEIDKRSSERIERIKELNPQENPDELRERRNSERKRVEEEDKKKKKKLKSIDDDPLAKYTDSADDDLHPLKTDE